MKTLLLKFALDALASKRLTKLVVEDAILDGVRDKLWDRFPPETSKLGYLPTCHACTSIWAAALVQSGVLPRWTRDTLALSEAVLTLKALVDDRHA